MTHLFKDSLQPLSNGMRCYITIPPQLLPLVNSLKNFSHMLQIILIPQYDSLALAEL